MITARIGPNAIIQTIAALRERHGPEELRSLLAGDAEGYLSRLPHEMIPEQEFHALVGLLVARLGAERAGEILYRSGQGTANYVRDNRIPALARALMGLLPAAARLRLLLPAIGRHAWTFVGSGTFRFGLGRRPWVSIAGHPGQGDLAAALCRYYCGAFTQLLRRLVSEEIVLREVTCQTRGGDACLFEIVL